jgi:integrase/recombinase XerD
MWVTGGVPVTHLRKMMLEELQRRNFSDETIRSYIHAVEDFSQRFNCSPDRLGPRYIREYQAELFQKRKLSAGSVAVRLAALRFFYCKTLRKAWSIADTPYPKRDHRLPAILSQEEVARLIQAAGTSFHRTVLMTLYATGARNREVTRLKFSDVDKQRMVVHIQGGKGRKDRDVMLSSKLLEELREHWHRLPRRPSLGTLQRRSFPQLNLHRARVHRNHGRSRSNGFTRRAQNFPPPSTPRSERASGKALTFTGT